MLTVSHVTKFYRKTPACCNVSFSIEPGTVSVLLGPNGAGKSTLLKSIIGYLRYQGEIRIEGRDNHSVEAKRAVGYVPEIPALYPNLTVWEHMEFIARAYRLTDYRTRAEALLERFEIADRKKKFGDELSKGMQQKLSLCLSLLPEPRLLLTDEPMVGLDPHAIKELKSLFAEMRAEGRSVLLSTHIIDSVDLLWDRALIMQQGVLRADVTRARLEASGKTLEDLFFAVTEATPAAPQSGDFPTTGGQNATDTPPASGGQSAAGEQTDRTPGGGASCG